MCVPGRCPMSSVSSAFESIPVCQHRPLRILAILVSFFFGLGLSGCKKESRASQEGVSSERAPVGYLELVYLYGSEKEKWINDVSNDFNQRHIKTQSGKSIFVRALPMGSG